MTGKSTVRNAMRRVRSQPAKAKQHKAAMAGSVSRQTKEAKKQKAQREARAKQK